MNVYAVDYQDATTTHRMTGDEALVDSTTSRALGPITDGVSAGGGALCGQRVYGVMGTLAGPAADIPGLCVDCESVWQAQRRDVVPAGWTSAERDAYWLGFDRGRAFADFMEHYRANAFGDETINTPWDVSGSGSPTLIARFDEGAEDGVRSYVIADWSPRW
jgi:hypothetical protein